METNVEPNAEEWSNEYSLQDESESELDGQKLYSFLMKKLNPYFDDTKPFTPLPKNTDGFLLLFFFIFLLLFHYSFILFIN